MMDLEDILRGENLAFYKNIQDLKRVTATARAIINRSHAMFKDIIHGDEFRKQVRGTEQEEDISSHESFHGECSNCGLQHGAHDFCIVREIIIAEMKRRESPRKSAAALPPMGQKGEDKRASSAQQTAPPLPPIEETSSAKLKQWESLLYRKMSPEALDAEHSKICCRYGVAVGKKFLLARSLAQEQGVVEPLFSGKTQQVRSNSKMASVTRDCDQQKKPGFPEPCLEFSRDVRSKMNALIDLEFPCSSKMPKQERGWKNIFKPKAMIFQTVSTVVEKQATIENDLGPSHVGDSCVSHPESCPCGLMSCDCDMQYVCNLPKKNCDTPADYRNNYLFAVREKLQKRRMLKGKMPPGFLQARKLSSKEVSSDVLRRNSELMMRKYHEVQKKELKKCIASAIGKDDMTLDNNVSKVAEITSSFTKPEEKTWDRWIEGFHAQERTEDDEGISGDSDIPTTRCSSITSSSTNIEFQVPEIPVKHIPFMEEPLKLVDVLFEKIYTRFRKSIQRNSNRQMANPYKRIFFSHVDHLTSLKHTDSVGGEVLDKLDLHFLNLKSLKPKKLLKNQKLKKLEAKTKQLSKMKSRRNRIGGIQLGKRYRRSRKSQNFTKEQGYIGFDSNDRKLLQKSTPERFFASCDLIGDESGALLSKKRVHYHYRLLRRLFNGTVESGDKEILMDEGMKERLKMFKKGLHERTLSQARKKSETKDEDPVLLNAASSLIRTPSKRDEIKLKSAPGHYSPTLCSRSKCYGNEQTILPGAAEPFSPNSSPKRMPETNSLHSHKEMGSCSYNGGSSGPTNEWGHWSNPLSAANDSFAKECKDSFQNVPKRIPHSNTSNNTIGPTRMFNKNSTVSKKSHYSNSFLQKEPFHLPTPPLSESSCDEMSSDLNQHQFPPKEEAHMEKSARIYRNPRAKLIQEQDGSELTDRSSDSYVPKLIEMPLKRASARQDRRGSAYLRASKSRRRFPCMSDSSSTDSEPVNHLLNIRKKRSAWDHKSGLGSEIAPFLGTQTYSKQHDYLRPTSERPSAYYESSKKQNHKESFTSPLPKAGRSILKKGSLPKPPIDGTNQNQINTRSLSNNTLKRQSFSDSCPSEGLIKPARVVTERLLKSTQGTPEIDLPTGSTKKSSAQSRATPDGILNPSLSSSVSKKTSPGALLGVSKSGQVETEADDSSLRQHPSVTIKQPKGTTGHHTRPESPENAVRQAADSDQLQLTGSLTASSSKRLSRRTSSKVVSEVFRQRSLVTSERSEKKEPQAKTKALKKHDEEPTLRNASDASMGNKLKKLEAVGPTKKRCFNLDIGQGINCVNYLKENAPGADEPKKKELVELLVTPVEVKKVPRKTAPKVEKETSLDSTVVRSQQSTRESTSASLVGDSKQSTKNTKVQSLIVHDQTPLKKSGFKTLDQIFKEVHGINKNNTPQKLLDHDYEYEAKTKQQLTKHKI